MVERILCFILGGYCNGFRLCCLRFGLFCCIWMVFACDLISLLIDRFDCSWYFVCMAFVMILGFPVVWLFYWIVWVVSGLLWLFVLVLRLLGFTACRC